MAEAQGRSVVGRDEVHLVEHQQAGDVGGVDLVQDPVHRWPACSPARLVDRGVDDVQDEVGVTGSPRGSLERRHQLVGQLADEPDGVGQQHV